MLKNVPLPFRLLYIGLVGAFVVYFGFQLYGVIRLGESPDWMFLTGSAACLIGVANILDIETRVAHAVTRMVDGAVIVGLPKKAITADVDAAALRGARMGLAIVASAEFIVVITGHILVPWLIQKDGKAFWSDGGMPMVGNTDALTFAGLLIVGLLASALVGWYLGKFAAYGRLQERVEICGGYFVMQTRAADQMGGLQPLVNIVRSQALLTLAPVVWLVLWLVLTAAVGSFLEQYGFWRLPLFILLAVAVFYATLGFFAPLRLLERVLDEQERNARARGPSGQQVVASVSNARQHIRPRSSTYLFLLAFFAASIVISAYWLPANANQGLLSLFFFGPL